jgi:hypothetical protein
MVAYVCNPSTVEAEAGDPVSIPLPHQKKRKPTKVDLQYPHLYFALCPVKGKKASLRIIEEKGSPLCSGVGICRRILMSSGHQLSKI